MENICHRINVTLFTNEKYAEKLVAKPNYECATIFDENLVAVFMKKAELVFNKPVYLGMSILDLSKTLTHDFNYNYMKIKSGENCRLLMTDTDSLMYEIQTEDSISEKFETSNFQESHLSDIKRMNKNMP